MEALPGSPFPPGGGGHSEAGQPLHPRALPGVQPPDTLAFLGGPFIQSRQGPVSLSLEESVSQSEGRRRSSPCPTPPVGGSLGCRGGVDRGGGSKCTNCCQEKATLYCTSAQVSAEAGPSQQGQERGTGGRADHRGLGTVFSVTDAACWPLPRNTRGTMTPPATPGSGPGVGATVSGSPWAWVCSSFNLGGPRG